MATCSFPLKTRVALLSGALLSASCQFAGGLEADVGQPDFNSEMVLRVLADIDYFVTEYSWLLVMLGF